MIMRLSYGLALSGVVLSVLAVLSAASASKWGFVGLYALQTTFTGVLWVRHPMTNEMFGKR